ncbi:MAG: IclR family transcriptional regulator [Acidimicrobiia bacterium]|nr:IclR family transcriptional regulator [Acidimicrobiia bacterium]
MTQNPTSPTAKIWRVVEGVVDSDEPVGPRGLGRKIHLDRSAVGRMLRHLAAIDVLHRSRDGYVPGPRLITLGRVLAARDKLPDEVEPILADLVARFDETCYACAFHGDVAVFTHEIQSSKPLRLVVELGRPVPLYAGAAGRAILSALAEGHVREIVGTEPLPRLGRGTLTTLDEILAAAATDRERGYSVSFEERVPGGAAVAAPFFGSAGTCQGSLVFTSPVARMDDLDVVEIGEAVAAAASMLSGRLGHEQGS